MAVLNSPTNRRPRMASISHALARIKQSPTGLLDGDWRVVYRIDDAGRRVLVLTIANRREVY
jgi:mRNA-degrading endonuclease RelE of RelBE toxin-antitoxin system